MYFCEHSTKFDSFPRTQGHKNDNEAAFAAQNRGGTCKAQQNVVTVLAEF